MTLITSTECCCSFSLHSSPVRQVLLYIQFYRWREVEHVPEIVQLASGRVGIWIQVSQTQRITRLSRTGCTIWRARYKMKCEGSCSKIVNNFKWWQGIKPNTGPWLLRLYTHKAGPAHNCIASLHTFFTPMPQPNPANTLSKPQLHSERSLMDLWETPVLPGHKQHLLFRQSLYLLRFHTMFNSIKHPIILCFEYP